VSKMEAVVNQSNLQSVQPGDGAQHHVRRPASLPVPPLWRLGDPVSSGVAGIGGTFEQLVIKDERLLKTWISTSSSDPLTGTQCMPSLGAGGPGRRGELLVS
jgi:hypothetical protein